MNAIICDKCGCDVSTTFESDSDPDTHTRSPEGKIFNYCIFCYELPGLHSDAFSKPPTLRQFIAGLNILRERLNQDLRT